MEPISEIKLAKFEMIITEACMWLYPNDDTDKGYAKFFWKVNTNQLEKYCENPYLDIVYRTCFGAPSWWDSSWDSAWNSHSFGFVDDNLLSVLKRITSKKKVYCPNSGDAFGLYEGNIVRSGIIFWFLVFAAIDEKFYRNEASMIADLACMWNFDKTMMEDWIKAVKYLLEGNTFSKNMDLDFQTAEANLFFKKKE